MLKIILTIICFFSFISMPKAITNIEIYGHTLIPNFKKETKTYNVYLDKNVEDIKVNVTKEENEIEVKNEGIIHLTEGENKVKLTVVKTDYTTEVYTLNINRGEEVEDKDNADLKYLEIESYDIAFQKDTLNYEINVSEFVDELIVNYEAENPNSKVKLTGSNNLNESTNIIEIKVSSENEKNTKIYRIKVNKVIPTFEIEDEKVDNIFGHYSLTKKEKIIIISVISIISFLILLLTYIILFKNRFKKKMYTSLHTLRK